MKDKLAELYTLVQETKSSNKLVCVITDLDDTILIGTQPEEGFLPGDDPRRVKIVDRAAAALREVETNGGILGVITNRGGKDAANHLRQNSIKKARIIGTYGWEHYRMQEKSEDDSVSIDERFSPFSKEITEILTKIREGVIQELGVPTSDNGAEIVFPIHKEGNSVREQAPLLIQQKGVSLELGFPLGLANIYIMNLMPLGEGTRKRVVEKLETIMQDQPSVLDWGIGGDADDPETKQRYTKGFEPTIKEGKGFAMKRMIEDIEREEKKEIGLIIYSGDSNPDAEAIKAAKEVAKERNGALHSLGIWVKGPAGQAEIENMADIHVEDVFQHAKILHDLASLLKNS